MTAERLAEIRKRADAASTGPWRVDTGSWWSCGNWLIGSGGDGATYYVNVTTDNVRASEFKGDAKTDAEFIAHARQDVPDLLAEVERLRVALKAIGECECGEYFISEDVVVECTVSGRDPSMWCPTCLARKALEE